MPELPETETIARDLDREVGGRRVASVEVVKPDVLRGITATDFSTRLAGRTLVRCWRRAKLVLFDLDSGDRLVVQPRFTGALLLDNGALADAERRYSTITLFLSDGRQLHYRDIRRLGTVSLMGPSRFASYIARLGVEPLDPATTPERLSGLLRGTRQAVKKALMDQRRIAGIGNIYANEALWRAGIDPSRLASSVSDEEATRLHDGIVSVLRESIEARGTSFRDYRDASGQKGRFSDRLSVYGRAGSPCHRCGARLIGTHAIDGRATVFCARCQT